MKAKGNSITKTAVWGLMGLLVLGLGGFGAVSFSGNVRTVGTVGDKAISVDQYARELQQQIRAIEAQTNEPLSFQKAQTIGLDRAVLQRLVRLRALDNEADQMGLSIGDENLRERIVQISSFQGIDGKFDREGYRSALQQAGLSEAAFEISLREEAGRALLQQAITAGVVMPTVYADTLINYVAEKRSFTWAKLSQDNLITPLDRSTDEELKTYYDENAEMFMLPASKSITYVTLSPHDLLDEVEVSDEELKQAYDDRSSEYNQPERRLVERLVFQNQEAADQAAAALEVGGTTFEALVEERGLALADIDMGDVSKDELGAAGDSVFAADVSDIVGPLSTNLGPALFRVNGILPALETSLDEARPTLQQDIAADRAGRLVEVKARELDDQLAGGASLEQIASDSKMTLHTIEWTQDSSEDIAAYAGFREAAAGLKESDFPKINQLDDGSIYAMRLDGTKPERPNPFEEARSQVEADWMADQLIAALTAQAETLQKQLLEGADFDAVGLTASINEGQTRDAFIEGTPEGFMAEVFKATPGDVQVVEGDDSVVLVRLDNISHPDENTKTQQLLEQLGTQLNTQLADDVFALYAADVVRRSSPQIDQQAINAVHVNFP